MEDPSNRSRLAKLLRFRSSRNNELTSLEEYVSRLKPGQEHIYWLAGASRAEVEKSPFVERLLARGYEVLYLIEAVDEYSIAAIPEFDGKKFQNIAKEGFTINSSEDSKKQFEELTKTFEPLTKWLNDVALKDKITKAVLSERLSDSPCALVASSYGWTGNMERLALSNAHQKADDPQRAYYLNQRKAFEINPRHPLIKELLKRVENEDTETAKDLAVVLFRTATLRSGYLLEDTADFADSIDRMLKKTLGVSLDEKVEVDAFDVDDSNTKNSDDKSDENTDEDADENAENGEHDEL